MVGSDARTTTQVVVSRGTDISQRWDVEVSRRELLRNSNQQTWGPLLEERSQEEHLAWLNTSISQMGTQEEEAQAALECQEPHGQVSRWIYGARVQRRGQNGF